MVQGVVPAEQVQGESATGFVAVGDRIVLAVHFLAAAGELGLVAEEGEERE